MVNKHVLLACVLAISMVLPLTAFGADIDELKATVEQLFTGLSERNADAVAATWHDKTVFFSSSSPFPIVGKTARVRGLKAFLGSLEMSKFQMVNTQYNITGDPGSVWGYLMVVTKRKDGPVTSRPIRYSIGYTKVDGKWLAVITHATAIGVGNM